MVKNTTTKPMGWADIPKFLEEHHKILTDYIAEGKLKEAKTYLHSLPASTYDAIVERSKRGYCFETLLNKIDELYGKKKLNDLYKISNYDGDDNFIF